MPAPSRLGSRGVEMLFRRLGAEQKTGCKRLAAYGIGSAASLTLSVIAAISAIRFTNLALRSSERQACDDSLLLNLPETFSQLLLSANRSQSTLHDSHNDIMIFLVTCFLQVMKGQ